MIKRFITFILCLSIIFCMGIGFTGCNQGTPVTSDNEDTTTSPTEDTTTPPVEDTTTSPAEDTTTPPAEDTTTPPAEDTTTPPAEDTTTPPAEDTTTPPAEDTTTPPAEDTTTPPVEDTTTPPAEDTTTPPVEDTTTPPTEDTTTPPTEDATDEIIASLVHIEARPDFAFRYDLTNTTAGEKSPIENDYYLSAYKVTNAQYAVFIAGTSHKAPSYWKNGTYPEGKGDHPVLNISYSDAVSYCEWLSEKYDDWSFRLPTEAEWENAAYGDYYGDTSIKYPNGKQTPSYNASTGELTTTFNFNGVIAAKLFKEYGSNYVVNYIKGDFAGASETLGECISISANGGVTNWANHGGNATKGYFLQTDLYAEISANGGYTTPVGSYAPNSLGLYDMAGNCWDITSSVIIAQNGLEKDVSCYAVRGGSWYATARSCTFYYRGEGRKNSASSTVGFRIAADYTPS